MDGSACNLLCIDAHDMSPGYKLMAWGCNGLDAQTWGYDNRANTIYLAKSVARLSANSSSIDSHRIASSSSLSASVDPPSDATKCMDLVGGNFSNGTDVQVWGCNDCWNQEFTAGTGYTPARVGDVDGAVRLPESVAMRLGAQIMAYNRKNNYSFSRNYSQTHGRTFKNHSTSVELTPSVELPPSVLKVLWKKKRHREQAEKRRQKSPSPTPTPILGTCPLVHQPGPIAPTACKNDRWSLEDSRAWHATANTCTGGWPLFNTGAEILAS
jgi:hypothetical protein